MYIKISTDKAAVDLLMAPIEKVFAEIFRSRLTFSGLLLQYS